MQSGHPIRSWAVAVLCGALCLAWQAAASDTAKKSTTTSTHPAAKHPKRKASAAKTSSSSKRSSSKTKGKTRGKRKRGQQAIESPRAREIQEALIRQHYLEGTPTGQWDASTQEALRRYQSDQGWQSKTVPDSRALIRLGLGPSKDGLLNPESAMTAGPLASETKAVTKPTASVPAGESKPQQ